MLDFIAWSALSMLEIVLITIFSIALVLGASFDRTYDQEAPKWWILVIGFLILAGLFWSSWSFSGALSKLSTWEFWKEVGFYIGLGLIYSVVEFTLAVRRAARKYAKLWKQSNQSSVRDFVSSFTRADELIKLDIEDNKPIPRVDREELAAYIGAWTMFWPAYFISLIFGDLLTEIWRSISSFLVRISTRFVRMAFKDVFK